ncbi:DUF6493 family protein [Virgisporangium aurantiacum]|uniref:Secreted protein n=1 Tax=Virgisporangium aurantiacum TaxID=175570 RepID=A0A8J4E6T9_9ACTN|nr:DUF6493 family protein [Virgisporangium aurantiacum]GIJ63791.1 hypothetical protein Vau01_113070 [Virgisporangium aurantiacum]
MADVERGVGGASSGSPGVTVGELERLLGQGSAEGLLPLLAGLDEPARGALAATVEVGARRLEAWPGPGGEQVLAYFVAAVGCLTPARAAVALSRPGLRRRWGAVGVDPMLRAAAGRPEYPLGDLATALAARLPRTDVPGQGWDMVAGLARAAGVAAPAHEGFVRGWLQHIGVPGQSWETVAWSARNVGLAVPGDEGFVRGWLPRTVPDQHGSWRLSDVIGTLRADPWLGAMLARVFEIDGLGVVFNEPRWMACDDGSSVSGPVRVLAVAELVREGRLDRAVVLDGCVGRLLRADRPSSLAAFVRLLKELAPGVREAADRANDFGRLIAAAPVGAATVAQKALRAAFDAGLVGVEVVLDASRETLARAERPLVRAQIGWLDALARADRGRVDEVLDVLAVAWHHPDLAIQETAVTVVSRHVGAAGPAGVAALRGAVSGLLADLPSRALALLGDPDPAATATAGPSGGDAAVDAADDAWPAPIASADELAEVAAVSFTTDTRGRLTIDAVELERLLAGLVERSAGDPAGTAAALRPVADRKWPPDQFRDERFSFTFGPGTGLLQCALASCVVAAAGREPPLRWLAAVADLPASARERAPARLILARLAEIGGNLGGVSRAGGPPLLLATPTGASGLVDPTVLVERLERAAREGWTPWPADLAQALLRLPLAAEPDLAARATALGSPAAHRVAARLAAGGVTPISARRLLSRTPPGAGWLSTSPRVMEEHPLVEVDRPAGADDPFDVLSVRLPEYCQTERYPTGVQLWPAVAPAYPEAIAAHLLNLVRISIDDDGAGGGAAGLPRSALAGGRFGPACALLIAYALGSCTSADRITAADTMLAFAAAGTLDAGAVGTEVGCLTAAGGYPVNRVLPVLGDVVDAGASTHGWHLLMAAIPELLHATPTPRGTPDLLALASRIAAPSGSPAALPPAVAETAGRPGRNRLVTEAQRLLRVATPGHTGPHRALATGTAGQL